MASPELAGWLAAHGLAKYAELLGASEVELEDLPLLSEKDLEELGLPLGPRKRLLAAARLGVSARISPAGPHLEPAVASPCARSPRMAKYGTNMAHKRPRSH